MLSEIRYTQWDGRDASSLHALLAQRPYRPTFVYERDLKAYRLEDIKADRGDPEKPAYNEVFRV